jgi:hypothetical protein
MTDIATIPATAVDIKKALMKAYAPPSHRIFFEVSNDTGTRARRWIDALAVGIWPSTGHEIVGIEIKVSRGDWKRELAEPQKAQELMRFCTRWYVACPDGMLKADELPATWGMLAYKDGIIRQKVTAKLLEPEPITPGFMMAILRNANAVDMELVNRLVQESAAEQNKRYEADLARAVENRVRDNDRNAKKALEVADLLYKITGENILNWGFDPTALAAAYLLMKQTGLHGTADIWRGLPGIANQLREAEKLLTSLLNNPLLEPIREAVSATEKA